MTWWFGPISLHSKSYADNGVTGHVSNCKLMFSSETEYLNTKMFTKTMNFPVNNLALVSLCTKNLTFETWNWFLIKKNGRSRPKTTSETHNVAEWLRAEWPSG